MSFNTPYVIAATSVVAALVLLQVCDVSGESCYPCRRNLKCPPLRDDCEPTMRTCGCCPQCKAKFGARCSNYGVNCESGLKCVNENDVVMPVVKWYDLGFEGRCLKVNMCQVITGSWQDILRDQRRPTAKFADEVAGTAD